MLVLRAEQLEMMRRPSIDRFENRMVDYLAAHYPSRYEELGEAGTRKSVRDSIDLGARHGIDTEGAVAGLIVLCLEYGSRFELSPAADWARGILEHPSLPGELKVRMIGERFESQSHGRKLNPVKLPSTESG